MIGETDALKAEMEAFYAANPGIHDEIRQTVATWGPLPDEAQRLWRAARRQYLASLTTPETL